MALAAQGFSTLPIQMIVDWSASGAWGLQRRPLFLAALGAGNDALRLRGSLAVLVMTMPGSVWVLRFSVC